MPGGRVAGGLGCGNRGRGVVVVVGESEGEDGENDEEDGEHLEEGARHVWCAVGHFLVCIYVFVCVVLLKKERGRKKSLRRRSQRSYRGRADDEGKRE